MFHVIFLLRLVIFLNFEHSFLLLLEILKHFLDIFLSLWWLDWFLWFLGGWLGERHLYLRWQDALVRVDSCYRFWFLFIWLLWNLSFYVFLFLLCYPRLWTHSAYGFPLNIGLRFIRTLGIYFFGWGLFF